MQGEWRNASTGEADDCKPLGGTQTSVGPAKFRCTSATQRAPDGGMLSVHKFEDLQSQVRCEGLGSADVLQRQVRCEGPDSADVLGRLAVENVGRANPARPPVLHVSGKHPDVCINGVHVD